MYDFVVYVCSYGMTCDETCKCLTNLKNSQLRYDVRWVTRDALIGRSRSRAASQFLWCDDSPYMIFIDGDMTFTPDDVEKMYITLQSGYPIVGGVYSVADGSFVPAQSYESMVFDNKVHEFKYVSTGFMGISRVALKQIRDTLKLPLLHKGEWCECYPFFESGGLRNEKIYISEDWDFCNKAKIAGLKVYLHTGIRLGHIKQRMISGDEAIYNMVEKSKSENALVNVECLAQSTLLSDAAEYLKMTPEEFSTDILNNPPARLAKEWNEKQGSTEDFYRENKLQFLDLVLFNSQVTYWNDRINPVGGFRGKKILDLGCGIGTASIFLAQGRNEVVGYDLNQNLIDFCNFRKEKFGLSNVSFTTDMPDVSQFDVVLAMDLFEHIEDLHSFILELGKMKPEARLYHADVFEDHPEHHPMHFDHSKNLDEWLKEAGFTVWDKRWSIRT